MAKRKSLKTIAEQKAKLAEIENQIIDEKLKEVGRKSVNIFREFGAGPLTLPADLLPDLRDLAAILPIPRSTSNGPDKKA